MSELFIEPAPPSPDFAEFPSRGVNKVDVIDPPPTCAKCLLGPALRLTRDLANTLRPVSSASSPATPGVCGASRAPPFRPRPRPPHRRSMRHPLEWQDRGCD